MKLWKNYLRPAVTLMVICLLVGAALAAVNAATAPVIAANESASLNATYAAVLPEADGFEALDCSIEGVTAVLRAKNGAGYVITAQSRGYGGQVPAAVAFAGDGTILRVSMLSNDETPGLGQKVTEESFTGQFAGRPAEQMTLADIDAVSGATISSKAALSAVDLACAAFEQVVGGGQG